jgi:hypothetical protein
VDVDKEIIRRTIRAHVDGIKVCYEKQLAEDPRLKESKVTYQFTISAQGKVAGSSVNRTSVNNDALLDCIGRLTCDFVFPSLCEGGVAVVSYPFYLSPQSGGE